MEAYLEHRFFMERLERRAHTWINPPAYGLENVGTLVDPNNWFSWHFEDRETHEIVETLEEWTLRVAPKAIDHLLDPDYMFFADAPKLVVAVSSIHSIAGIYRDVFQREVLSKEGWELFQRFSSMYVLRLRHDCYAIPTQRRGAIVPAAYQNMFYNIPNLGNPPTVDVAGFTWIHPKVPEDSATASYFWNAIYRGERFEYCTHKKAHRWTTSVSAERFELTGNEPENIRKRFHT